MVIEGPAGIGKTSLLTSARQKAAQSGMTVFQARGSPLEREYAMGLVRQCLERTVRGDPAHEELFAGAARLARAAVVDVCDDLDTAPGAVLHGLYWLLANLADRAPLHVAIDDAQWADDPSLRFLASI